MEEIEESQRFSLVMSYVDKSGMVFRVKPLISTKMDAEQIKGELKVAINRLKEEINSWYDKYGIERD